MPKHGGAGQRPGRMRHDFLIKYYFTCGSSNGRTAGFGPANGGSSPPPRAVTRCRWTNRSGRLSVKEECTGSSPVRHPPFTFWTRSLIGKASLCDGEEWQFESARVHKTAARLRRLTEGQRSSTPLVEVRVFPESLEYFNGFELNSRVSTTTTINCYAFSYLCQL